MIDYELMLQKQRDFFATGKTKAIPFRMAALRDLSDWIKSHEKELMGALKADLNKAPFEAYATEIGIVLDEIKHTLHHLKRWSRDKRVRSPIKQFPSKSFIRSEPYGVALILSPWNYPFQLSVAPLVAALSAGNCAVIKPSAYSPATSKAVAAMIRDCFDEAYVSVIEGGRKENELLLEQRFDYICFTGSVAVGRVVMQAASKYLTPVTLELGGKSPCIVDETADIPLAAKRIAWGKFLNAGQTCVAPDYILVHKSVKQDLIAGIQENIRAFYGDDPCESKEYPKIIHEKHFNRLKSLMQGETILCGGQSNANTLQIQPTLIDGVDWNSAIMQEEIFGPLLPILTFDSLDEVIELVIARPKPLALYFFTKSCESEQRILKDISFGGGCINDTVVHLATSHMPFGGVGESGVGGYHGRFGFDNFSHKKSILKKSLLIDIPLRYPPYKNHLSLLKKM